MDKGELAASRPADDGHLLAGANCHGDIVHDRVLTCRSHSWRCHLKRPSAHISLDAVMIALMNVGPKNLCWGGRRDGKTFEDRMSRFQRVLC